MSLKDSKILDNSVLVREKISMKGKIEIRVFASTEMMNG
jgi:hypothetical protein